MQLGVYGFCGSGNGVIEAKQEKVKKGSFTCGWFCEHGRFGVSEPTFLRFPHESREEKKNTDPASLGNAPIRMSEIFNYGVVALRFDFDGLAPRAERLAGIQRNSRYK